MKRKSMSKNLTRKGFAFGALVALGASVFAGTPAFAADAVVLAADYSVDKTLAVPVTETIRLNASLAPGSTAANIAQLKYKVVTDSSTIASVQTISGGTNQAKLLGTYAATGTANTNMYTTQTPNTTGAAVTTFGTLNLSTTYWAPAVTPTAVNVNTITLGVNAVPDSTTATTGVAPSATTATRSVTVTAFIDANLNGLLDTGEVSQEQTVKFVKYSEVTTSTTVTAPTQNDTTATALVNFTNVNNQALADVITVANGGNGSNAASIGAYFTYGDGTALKTADAPVSPTAATNTSTTEVTVTVANSFTAGDVVTVAGLSAFNGSYTVATASSTSFTYAVTGAANGTNLFVAGATVTRKTVKATAAAYATDVLTVTAANSYAAGDVVTLAGFTPTAYNKSYVVATATSSAFTVAYVGGAGAVTVGTGTATRTASNTEAVQFTPVTGYSATNLGFKFTTGTVPGLAKSTAVKVQPLFNSKAALTATLGSGGTKTIGTSQTASVTSRTLGSFVGAAVQSITAEKVTASAAAGPNVALNKEKQVYFLAKDNATTPAAKSGQAVAVAVTVAGATLSATTTVTINGTTYSSAAALPGATGVAKLALTTGADGKAVITYKTTGFADTNDVIFTAVAENYTAVVTANEQTLAYSQYIENNEGDLAVTTDGAAVKLDVIVLDQFGGTPADGTFQVNATLISNGQTTFTAATAGTGSDTAAAVVGGKATLSLVDNGTGVGTLHFDLARYSVAANGVLTSPVGLAGASITGTLPVFGTHNANATDFSLVVKTAADVAAGEVLVGGNTSLSATTGTYSFLTGNPGHSTTTPKALTYSAFGARDSRKILGTDPTNADLAGTAGAVTGLTITGTVNSASTATYGGVAVPNAVVTVSGAGMQFAVTQETNKLIYATDSITFVASSTGTYSVDVWSHIAGKNVVTIKSGTGSATVNVYFAAAAEIAATKVSVTVADGASQFQAGRALDVTVKVTDDFGNPVALTGTASLVAGKLVLTQTGAGYLSNVNTAGTTDATGSFATKLITNFGDLGTSTITAKVDFDNTTGDLVDATATKSAEFGVTDADVTVGGRAVYASVEFAKGKTVTVSVDGKRLYSKLMSTDAYTELKFTQKTAGKHVVTVRVSGGIVYSETVTTTK
jgi:hypothetical protein